MATTVVSPPRAEEEWRKHIRQQIEEEINKRVRDALETPPLERLRRRQQSRAKQNATQSEPDDLNSHLDLTEKEREYLIARRRQQRIKTTKLRPSDSDPDLTHSNASAYQRYQAMRSVDVVRGSTTYEISPPTATVEPVVRPAYVQSLGYVQQVGTESYVYPSSEGKPVYPDGTAPLLPHPVLKNIIHLKHEPLSTSLPPVAVTHENQITQYTHKWRGISIVYDSERPLTETTTYAQENPLIAPSLIFESRFESGNLRQARRVGQFEYELVLKTDVFTKRHTQWYYFRIQNMVPGCIYKFRIINLLKKDSLYNYGMRPLFYSEKNANIRNMGWIRHGHHISYSKNTNHLLCSLLSRELNYYELEWQMDFPHPSDTCYLAHCYPYTYSDLKAYLDQLVTDPVRCVNVKREVLCQSKAGNMCYMITVTNFDQTETKKKCVVVSGRVHPGESNSSWMVKGLCDFITSNHPEAVESRNKFIFKIIPMLNPDGVVVGNYRCSLQARDLNRNYRHPKRENFPTVWHMKKLVENLQNTHGVFVYCDFHGHSRKSNVFMYGCNSVLAQMGSIQSFLDDRMLPFLISRMGQGLFNFEACKFQIKKCKEATGRVVMFRQLHVKNSFTMEATFSGTCIDKHGSRHFNQRDFMDAGEIFARGVLHYSQILEDEQKETEMVLELTKMIANQLLRFIGASIPPESQQEIQVLLNHHLPRTEDHDKVGNMTQKSADEHQEQQEEQITQKLQNAMQETVNSCVTLLENLSVSTKTFESESSDSDSESEPEQEDSKRSKKRKKRSKRSKDKKQVKHLSNLLDKRSGLTSDEILNSRQLSVLNCDLVVKPLPCTRTLPAIGSATENPNEGSQGSVAGARGAVEGRGMRSQWNNPYEGRSNGGIPCFSEERSLERASKKMAELQQRLSHKSEKAGDPDCEEFYGEILALQLERQRTEERILYKSYRLPGQTNSHSRTESFRRAASVLECPGKPPLPFTHSIYSGSEQNGKVIHSTVKHQTLVPFATSYMSSLGYSETSPHRVHERDTQQCLENSNLNLNCPRSRSEVIPLHSQWYSSDNHPELFTIATEIKGSNLPASKEADRSDYCEYRSERHPDRSSRTTVLGRNHSYSDITVMTRDYSQVLAHRMTSQKPPFKSSHQKRSIGGIPSVSPLHQHGFE